MQITAITGTVIKGELKPTASLSLFPDGTDVIIIARADWDIIAGSDSTRSQLAKVREMLDAIRKEPEKAKEILEVKKDGYSYQGRSS